MAHEITQTNGVYEMAFVGDRSEIWHGLGQELTRGSSIETWQREAGMNWDINSSDVTFHDEGKSDIYEGKKVLYRSDTKQPLSIVSSRYKVLQPKEVLEFFRGLVDDIGMELSTAGTLFDGRKFWALADTNQKVKLNGGSDVMKGYLLLSTSCDGSLATAAQFTSVRVVCNNTLSVAVQGKTRVATRHSTIFKPNEVKKHLGLYEDSWDTFARKMEQMTMRKLTAKDSYNWILDFIAKDAADPSNCEIGTVNEIHNLYMGGGMGSDVAGETAFGLLNAITEYYDHHTGRIASNKLNSSFWGTAEKKKQEALNSIATSFGITA